MPWHSPSGDLHQHHLVMCFCRRDIGVPSRSRKGVSTYNQYFCAFQIHFSAASGGSDDYENETFVWGTTIRAQKISRDFVQFFELFMEEDADEPKYIKLMREVSLATAPEQRQRHAPAMIRTC